MLTPHRSPFTLPDIFSGARSLSSYPWSPIDSDSPSSPERQIDDDTLTHAFKAVEVFGMKMVVNLCHNKIYDQPETDRDPKRVSVGDNANMLDWITQLNKEDLEKVANCILAVQNKKSAILLVFVPLDNRKKEVQKKEVQKEEVRKK